MAINDTLKKVVSYTECSGCGESIARGSLAYRSGSRWRHPACSFEPARVAASPTPTRPARREVGYREFGGLLLDAESFSAWEREYDEENA